MVDAARVVDDGWRIDHATRERAYRFARDHAVPRPYGPLDQLKTDMRSISAILWVAVVAMTVLAIAQAQYAFLVAPALLVWLFGRTFVQLCRTWRTGELVVITGDRMIRALATGAVIGGRADLGGSSRALEVAVPIPGVQELLAREGRVEILALVDVGRLDKAPPIGLAIRPSSAAGLVPGATAACGTCRCEVERATAEVVAGNLACAACATRLRAESTARRPQGTGLLAAAGLGVVGALAGAAVWAAIAISTNVAVGYVAVLIGYLTGHGVRIGAGEQRGPALQRLAAALALFGLVAAKYAIYAYAVVKLAHDKGHDISYLNPILMSLFPKALVHMASPFDVVFLLLAISAAYRVPRAS